VKLQHIVSLILATISFAALGQPANPFVGDWKVSWQGEKRAWQANLTINESGGSWQTFSAMRKETNVCIGREVPISIKSSSAEAMTIKLKYSEVLRGCADGQIVLTRVDDTTIAGKLRNWDLMLSRK
jgi:hypothetical protein